MGRAVALLASVLVLAGCTATPAPTPTADVFTPIVASVLEAPIPAASTDGAIHLAYELLLSNMLSQPTTIETVAVSGGGGTLLELSGEELSPWISVYGSTPGDRVIGAGQQAMVWLDVVVDSSADVPTALTHEVTLTVPEPNLPIIPAEMTESIAPVTVSTATPIVIGPPLEGDNWLDANSCCTVTPHRGAVNPINGSLHVPERFGIDYVQLDSENRIFSGDITSLKSYEFYGANILAVGDGPIVSMVTDLPDEVPGAHPTGLTLAEYGGNNIVQDLGGGNYAFYAHLQGDNPFDLAVGQQLTKGSVIGLLGNSGNTDTPHLHFHIMDSPSPLASNGLPFLIDEFDYVGRVVSAANLDEGAAGAAMQIDTGDAGKRTRESPLFLDLTNF